MAEITTVRFKKTILSALIPALLLLAAFPLGASAGSVLLGDLDVDGTITASDARLALRSAVKLESPTSFGISVGDVDRDDSVTSADARIILRAAVELESMNGASVDIPDGESLFNETEEYSELFSKLDMSFPEAPEIKAEPDTFTFVIYGHGHAVGLTQYGAVAMGNAGFPYDYILSYYFSGSTLARDTSYPKNTNYAGETVNTEELVTRITYMEIGGIAKEKNALKAQAVAVFTLLKRFNFNVSSRGNVGYAYKSYDACSDMVKQAVKEVIGEYVVRTGDASLTPVLTVYSASCAGSTVNAYDAWHGDNYPVSVSSPFDSHYSTFVTTYTITSEQLKARILKWNSSVKLSDDPSKWLEILSHNASVDSGRGYVTSLRVGDKTLDGIGAIDNIVGLRSGCYTVTYTPKK
ncbi:MAG: hypothetical protein IJS90_02955 [Clostridia bacterium]|nr:hypothetical protein [Clostridia bacterium]